MNAWRLINFLSFLLFLFFFSAKYQLSLFYSLLCKIYKFIKLLKTPTQRPFMIVIVLSVKTNQDPKIIFSEWWRNELYPKIIYYAYKTI